MAARCSYFESPLCGLLAADIFEVDGELLELAENLLGADGKRIAPGAAHQSGIEEIDDIEE